MSKVNGVECDIEFTDISKCDYADMMHKSMIKSNAPEGATHYDSQDYWKFEDELWYIWLESCKTWKRIVNYESFHALLEIKPL